MKKFLWFIAVLVGVYFLLMIPDSKSSGHIVAAGQRPFIWNNDSLWLKLEKDFVLAKSMKPSLLDNSFGSLQHTADSLFDITASATIQPADSNLQKLQDNFFALASFVAVKEAALPWYLGHYNRVRILIKQLSVHWNMQDKKARNQVYSLLYGMRAATEEVILQLNPKKFSPALLVQDEKSATASAKIFGIEVHSGDLLVSRGGAEVSALISRGNDYPGNFSHVALLYIDDKTGKPYLIEAHIEKGVAVSSVDQYEQDKKLRFMVMRPRADLPEMIANPMLPQQAASMMFKEAAARHIPYDFKMDFHDSAALFCSEVASFAYRKSGLQLWQPISTISSQGVVNWLHDFGVENFVTQMPSDLEYDPQLSVVAEWRDLETLFKDHLDNAVMDAMLEKADAGKKISYNYWMLPVVRVIKGYCSIRNKFGKSAMIPEGMSATRALKNQYFVELHVQIKSATLQMANQFIADNHYRPPYWQLVQMTRLAAANF